MESKLDQSIKSPGNLNDHIRWGIIGCGNVTEVKSGPAFSKVPASSLVAVMRRDIEKARDYAHRHGVKKYYGNALELIHDEEINAIYIATPPSSHEEYTIEAFKAGKPVYVEKPMTLDAAGAQRMVEAARQYDLKISVAHYRRRQPLFLKVKELLDENHIGNIRCVNLQLFQPVQSGITASTEVNWRIDPAISGGGLFHDLAPHQLDLMIYFFGDPVSSQGISLNQGGLYQADDLVSGTILFEKNIVFNGTWCFTVPESETRDYCEIIGSEGKISFSVFEHRKIEVTKNGLKKIIPFDPLQHVQEPMIAAVVQYFLGMGPNPCPVEDGLKVMRLIDSFTR